MRAELDRSTVIRPAVLVSVLAARGLRCVAPIRQSSRLALRLDAPSDLAGGVGGGNLICGSYFNGRAKCGEPYAPAPDIEAEVEELFRRVKLPDGAQERFEQILQRAIAGKERRRAQSTQFIAKRLHRLANDKDRLVDLYLAGDIDRTGFRARKEAIETEVLELESRMGDDTIQLGQARELFAAAQRLVDNCPGTYLKASPTLKKMWNQAMFSELVVRDRRIASYEYQEPFRLFIEGLDEGNAGSNKDLIRTFWWSVGVTI